MTRTESTYLPPLQDNEKSILRVNSPKLKDLPRTPTNFEGATQQPENVENNHENIYFDHSNLSEETYTDNGSFTNEDDYFDSLHKSLLPKIGQPKIVTKDETERFRMDLRQTLFTDMLRNGFNKSFQEVYKLEEEFREENKFQGINAPVMLTDNQFKQLCEHLQHVESFERSKNLTKCYKSLKNLAEKFESVPFVNQHLLKRSFRVALQVGDSDEQRTLADAHKSVGMNFFRLEKYDQAYDHLNRYMEIVDQSNWRSLPEEFNYYIDACNALRLFYVRLGELTSNPEEALDHFQMAHSYAALCDNKRQIKQVSHKLALIYEKLGRPELAVEHLEKFFSIAQQEADFHNIDTAAEVLAKVYDKIKMDYNVQDTLQVLETFVENVDKTDDRYGAVCSCLGSIYTSKNEMEIAQNYLKLSYEAAMAKSSKDALDDSKIQVSIASAHQMLASLFTAIDSNTSQDVKNILLWKNNRINNITS